jgi:uncharacterized protein YbjT (DUF2867 family)
MSTKTILIVGGTGLIGGYAAVAFRKAGYVVRILSRDATKAALQFSAPYEVIQGDVTDPNALAPAIDGCTGVHIVLPNVAADEGVQSLEEIGCRNVIHAAADAGVEQITYVSGTTVCDENAWFAPIRSKLLAEQVIAESGIPFTILKPTWIMETLPKFVRGSRAMVFGKSRKKWRWVSAADLARMTVRAHENPDAAGKYLHILGTEAFSFREALELLSYVAFPSVRVKVISFTALRIMALLYRRPQLTARIPLMKYFDRVTETGDPSQANELLGAPDIRLAEWARTLRDTVPDSGSS